MDRLFKIMTFFRIIDVNDQLLSITSLAMYISLFRLCTVPQASYGDVGAVMITFANYGFKKFINKPQSKGSDDTLPS